MHSHRLHLHRRWLLAVAVSISFVVAGGLVAPAATASPWSGQEEVCFQEFDAPPTPEMIATAPCDNTSAARGTPDGFTASPNGRLNATNYQSDWRYVIVRSKDNPEYVLAAVQTRLHQRLLSGIKWMLTLDFQDMAGYPQIYETSSSYKYYCGVNLPLQDDELCSDYANDGAVSYDDGEIEALDSLEYSFGFLEYIVKFPMLQHVLTVENGNQYGFEFRGWDVCIQDFGVKSLCTESGLGYEPV